VALTLPCYGTREEVRQALDVKQAAWNNTQVDRAIDAARDSVDKLCNRQFYPNDSTVWIDWPNFQRAYPWRVWLDAAELADVTVNPPVVTTGGDPASNTPGTVIPDSAIFWGNPRYNPPFTYFELDRSQSYSFGSGSTPQRSISVTGTFGYQLKTSPSGTLASSALSTDTAITASASGLTLAGVGDMLIMGMSAGSERMLITDARFTSTSIAFTGLTTASMADNILAVPDGTQFSQGEVVQIDTEWCLIQNILGNNLQLKRAWDGSILAAHTSGAIWAKRQFSVLRGQFGTSAADYSSGAQMYINVVPGLVKELAVAEAVTSLTQETASYANAPASTGAKAGAGISVNLSGDAITRQAAAGAGLFDLRDRCFAAYGRKGRSRVV